MRSQANTQAASRCIFSLQMVCAGCDLDRSDDGAGCERSFSTNGSFLKLV